MLPCRPVTDHRVGAGWSDAVVSFQKWKSGGEESMFDESCDHRSHRFQSMRSEYGMVEMHLPNAAEEDRAVHPRADCKWK